MEKPENFIDEYKKYQRREIKYSELPIEVKEYRAYTEFVRNHPEYPELINMNKEEYLELKSKIRKAAITKWRKTMSEKSEEEIKSINKKKGSFYTKLSEEEKKKHNEKLRERSNNFWKSMSEDERRSFGKYRESLLTQEMKDKRYARFHNGYIKYKESLTEEDIKMQLVKMNEGRAKAASRISNDVKMWWKNMDPDMKEKMIKKIMLSTNGKNNLHKKFEEYLCKYIPCYKYESEYPTTNNGVTHCWDYAIFRDNKLCILIDLDGAYFHADICDYDGIHSRIEYDNSRFLSVPSKIKHLIIRELNFDEDFSWLLKIINLSYEEFINLETKYLVSMPCPYPEYTSSELLKSFDQLQRMNCDDKYHRSLNVNTRIGDRLIHHFCHNLLWANIEWNKDYIRNALLNHEINYPHMNKNKILQTVPHLQIISPAKAKMIINRYGKSNRYVYDDTNNPSIFLATVSLNKIYCYENDLSFYIKSLINFLNDNAIKCSYELFTNQNDVYYIKENIHEGLS